MGATFRSGIIRNRGLMAFVLEYFAVRTKTFSTHQMKITEYIAKNNIRTPSESFIEPEMWPPSLFIQGEDASFCGRNTDRSVCVALYPQKGVFVLVEPKGKTSGLINEDYRNLH